MKGARLPQPVRAAIFATVASVTMIVMLAAAIAQSISNRPFPQPKITPEQWQEFFAQVKAKPGIMNVSKPETPDVIALADKEQNTVYYFTNGGPAHPAVVIEKIVQTGPGINLETTGYFAGAEEPFAKWFGAFQVRAASIREQMKQGH